MKAPSTVRKFVKAFSLAPLILSGILACSQHSAPKTATNICKDPCLIIRLPVTVFLSQDQKHKYIQDQGVENAIYNRQQDEICIDCLKAISGAPW